MYIHNIIHVWVDGSKGSLQGILQPRLIYTLRLNTCKVLLLHSMHSPSLRSSNTGIYRQLNLHMQQCYIRMYCCVLYIFNEAGVVETSCPQQSINIIYLVSVDYYDYTYNCVCEDWH